MNNEEPASLEITYYTDPLCCWSWAFEPQWRKLVYTLKGKLRYRYCMGGLLPAWKHYHDNMNSVSRPAQMGPVWMHAKQLSGMPLDYSIWMKDAPASSYPACVAVKCAQMQSPPAGEQYLRMVREAVMMRGQNIARKEVLFQVAQELQKTKPDFDAKKFEEDVLTDTGLEAFRTDMEEVKVRNITRFPALIVRNNSNKAILISGYRPFHILMNAINQFVETSEILEVKADKYCEFWGSVTERELQEIAT